MQQPPIAAVLRAALLAAIVAGSVTGAFHLLVSDRVVDRAVALEQARHPDDDHAIELFTRRTQKAGLVAGAFIYAFGMGLLFGGVYFLAGERLPGGTHRRRALLLAAFGLWALYLAPFFKYPANPPGSGDPNTIYYRQVLYLAFVVLTALGIGAAIQLHSSLISVAVNRWRSAVGAVAAYVAYWSLLFLAMPGNPDHNDVPVELLRQFRAYSVAGAVLFWLVFGVIFGEVLRRQMRPRSTADLQAPTTIA